MAWQGVNARRPVARHSEFHASTLPVDREIVRSLSESIAESNRLAFARSFTHAIVMACWRKRGLARTPSALPETVERATLSEAAKAVAVEYGAALARLTPSESAYLIGAAYTSAIPSAYRAQNGIFYTPPELVAHLVAMADAAGVDWRKARVLDPACGGGAFLLAVAERMIASSGAADPVFNLRQLGARLRGYDIDPFGAWLGQVVVEMGLCGLIEAAGRPMPSIVRTCDSLDLVAEELEAYDLIIGNPPYGRVSLTTARREFFARSVHGHANLYGVFVDAALHCAKQGGVIAYVTPTSMLSGLYFKALRSLLATEAPPLEVNFVGERDGVFTDVLQEMMLTTYRRDGGLRKGRVGFITFADGQTRFRTGGSLSMPIRPQAPWVLPRSAERVKLVRRLRSMPHRLADYGYGVSTGPLVWNRFKSQFRETATSDSYPVIWAECITRSGQFIWRSERRNHAPWFAAKRPKDDWLIVDRPCVLAQRTTAKEQPRRLIAAELPASFIRRHHGVTIENHINMVRATSGKPSVPAAVIASLLNSYAVDAAFRCINGSVAVSAYELEELPLPSPSVMADLTRLVTAGAATRKIEAVISTAYRVHDAPAAP
jgi:adenine-specific DNA-methyltransferase